MHDVKLNSRSATDDAVMQLPEGKMALCVCVCVFHRRQRRCVCVCVCQGPVVPAVLRGRVWEGTACQESSWKDNNKCLIMTVNELD